MANIYLIIIGSLAFTTTWSGIKLYLLWRGIKNNPTHAGFLQYIKKIFGTLSETMPIFKRFKKNLFGPVSLSIWFIGLVAMSPFLFLMSIFSGIKKLVGYKTQLDKEIDAHEAEQKRLEAEHKEFMETEGVDLPDEINAILSPEAAEKYNRDIENKVNELIAEGKEVHVTLSEVFLKIEGICADTEKEMEKAKSSIDKVGNLESEMKFWRDVHEKLSLKSIGA